MRKFFISVSIIFIIPAVVYAGFSFGLIKAAKKTGDKVNEQVTRRKAALLPDTQAPTVPTNLTATTASSTQINLSWTASTDNVGVTSYKVYRNASATPIATPTVTTYNNTGLTASTAYSYTVCACDAASNCSAQSTTAFATTSAPPQSPPAPTNLTAVAVSSCQIDLSWTAATDANSYNIYWSMTSGVTTANGTKISSVTSPYTHTGRTKEITYYYVVTAVNTYGESSESSEINATPKSQWAISTIDTTGDVGKHTSITTDANKKEHISYYDITNMKLKYATNSSGSWVVATVADASGYGTSIAVDSNGKVHIAYEGANGDLMYATNSSGSWAATVLESSAWSDDVSMALDSNNKVHISYFSLNSFDLKYATDITGSWVTSIIVNGGATGPLPGYSTSIDIDSNDKVHMCYYDDSSPDSIKYITNASGSWQITQIDTIGFAAGWETSLVVDSSNKVHISYYDWTNDAVKYATNASGTWQTSTIVDIASSNVWNSSIAVDSSNHVHISYGSSKYATNSSGLWIVSKIDEAWTGSDNSIAVDTTGGVHISYYDGYNHDLKYATKE